MMEPKVSPAKKEDTNKFANQPNEPDGSTNEQATQL